MKAKMKTFLFALAIGATSASAQTIAEADRFGHGEDSIKCLQNISLYQEHVKTKTMPKHMNLGKPYSTTTRPPESTCTP